MLILLFSINGPVGDSAEVSQDTTTADLIKIFEIPDIIQFGDIEKTISRTVLPVYETEPSIEDMDLGDLLFRTPAVIANQGRGQFKSIIRRGTPAQTLTFYLNGHRLTDRLNSRFNLTDIPLYALEATSTGFNLFGDPMIDLRTKINRYEIPFSYIRVTTGGFGATAYNIDFTRAINNDLGLYLNGLYHTSAENRENSDFTLNSFYTDLYYNQIVPSRFDFIYSSNEYGFPGDDLDTLNRSCVEKLTDASFVFGSDNHHIAFYYTTYHRHFTNTTSQIIYSDDTRTTGIDLENYNKVGFFNIIYRLIGEASGVESDLCNTHNSKTLHLWTVLHLPFNSFDLFAGDRSETDNFTDFQHAPFLYSMAELYDSTYIFGRLGRNYRKPSIYESSAQPAPPYSSIRGDPSLNPEYCWVQEVGIQGRHFTVAVYKYLFENLIILQPDGDDIYQPTALESWRSLGIENYFDSKLKIRKCPTRNSETEITVGFTGNLLIDGDSLPFIPKANSNLFASIVMKSEKFLFRVDAEGQFFSKRFGYNGEELEPFHTLSITATARFVTLSFTLRTDNILNQQYNFVPNYTMPQRNFNFTIKWEFWN